MSISIYLAKWGLAFCIPLILVFGTQKTIAQDEDPQRLPKGQLLEAPEIKYERDRPSDFDKAGSSSSIVYEEGFEGGVSGWTARGVWAIGEPTK